jgi:tetratricopeptide (TPR) repeat protein
MYIRGISYPITCSLRFLWLVWGQTASLFLRKFSTGGVGTGALGRAKAFAIHATSAPPPPTDLWRHNPSTLMSMSNLAIVLRAQGKYEQAEEVLRQALGLCETVLGKEHPDTLRSINNLATVLSDQGKYEQAEEMHRQALGLSETVLGKEHPNTLTSMNNLALVLSN